MKAAFVFIMGLLIAIFLLLPSKNLDASIQNDNYYDTSFGEVEENKPKLTKLDKLFIKLVKSTIDGHRNNEEGNISYSTDNTQENFNENDF